MTDKEKIAQLLSSSPLYRKIEVSFLPFDSPSGFEDLTFSFFCPNENNLQTFKLTLEPESVLGELPTNLFKTKFKAWNFNERKTKYCQHYSATCQYCNNYKIHFLLSVETAKPVSLSNASGVETHPNQIVKKIGQHPPYEISIDPDLRSYFKEEDIDNYKKALICLSQNFSIAAFAYLRRIVENELLQLISDLAQIDTSENNGISVLLEKYYQNHQMSPLIEGITDYLPSSLKSLGSNPLKILHSQLSGGIHSFSEEECYEKASLIDTILKFVIKKIREENSDVKAVRDAIKKLSNNSK